MSKIDRVNILMVDDQPGKAAQLRSHSRRARRKSHQGEVRAARRSNILLKNDIAVVLMDVSMPEIDGFELADMIRQHPRFQNTAIIFISGSASHRS